MNVSNHLGIALQDTGTPYWTTLLKREVSLNILQLHRLYNRVMGVLGGNSELLNEGTVVPTSSCSLFQVRVVSVR